jgi:hypothetical protein
MIPGDPGRPYVVVGNTYGIFAVDYKVTFTKGAGAGVSYLNTSLEGFDLIRKDAERQGADAVIYLSIVPIPLADTVVKDEAELMNRKNFVLIQFFGTCVKFVGPPPIPRRTSRRSDAERPSLRLFPAPSESGDISIYRNEQTRFMSISVPYYTSAKHLTYTYGHTASSGSSKEDPVPQGSR